MHREKIQRVLEQKHTARPTDRIVYNEPREEAEATVVPWTNPDKGKVWEVVGTSGALVLANPIRARKGCKLGKSQ